MTTYPGDRRLWALTLLLLIAITLVAAAFAPAKPSGRAPSILGPLTIVESDSIVGPAGPALGAADFDERKVYVLKRLEGRWRQTVLYHEACHVALFDFGMGDMPMSMQERVCDAMGYAWSAHE